MRSRLASLALVVALVTTAAPAVAVTDPGEEVDECTRELRHGPYTVEDVLEACAKSPDQLGDADEIAAYAQTCAVNLADEATDEYVYVSDVVEACTPPPEPLRGPYNDVADCERNASEEIRHGPVDDREILRGCGVATQ